MLHDITITNAQFLPVPGTEHPVNGITINITCAEEVALFTTESVIAWELFIWASELTYLNGRSFKMTYEETVYGKEVCCIDYA